MVRSSKSYHELISDSHHGQVALTTIEQEVFKAKVHLCMQRLLPLIYKEVTAFLIEHLQPSQD